jgi:hypothetical protein
MTLVLYRVTKIAESCKDEWYVLPSQMLMPTLARCPFPRNKARYTRTQHIPVFLCSCMYISASGAQKMGNILVPTYFSLLLELLTSKITRTLTNHAIVKYPLVSIYRLALPIVSGYSHDTCNRETIHEQHIDTFGRHLITWLVICLSATGYHVDLDRHDKYCVDPEWWLSYWASQFPKCLMFVSNQAYSKEGTWLWVGSIQRKPRQSANAGFLE